jgi:hypothetical protein
MARMLCALVVLGCAALACRAGDWSSGQPNPAVAVLPPLTPSCGGGSDCGGHRGGHFRHFWNWLTYHHTRGTACACGGCCLPCRCACTPRPFMYFLYDHPGCGCPCASGPALTVPPVPLAAPGADAPAGPTAGASEWQSNPGGLADTAPSLPQ